MKKMLVEEHAGSVLYQSEYNAYFRTNSRLFPATEFLAEVLQHLPDAGSRLIRRYGLYSSRSGGTWHHMPHLLRLAPEGWQKDHQPAVRLGPALQDTPDQSVSAMESRSAPWSTAVSPETARDWARLLAKVYEVDLIGGSWPQSGQREPLALHPLWFPDAGPRRHHRSSTMPENPPPSHKNRRGPPGTRRRFPRLTRDGTFSPVPHSRDRSVSWVSTPRRSQRTRTTPLQSLARQCLSHGPPSPSSALP